MDPRFTIGLDLGGTNLKAALVTGAGEVERFTQRPARAGESEDAPLEVIIAAVADLRAAADGPLAGIGLGCPGVVDPASGALVGATPHLPHWRDFPLRARLATCLACGPVVDNDANLAALGEHRAGAARGTRVSITVAVGTGIGCGVVIDGRVFRGAHGGAGELGHLPLGSGRACRCGVEGCIEPECSGGGLVARAAEAGLDARDSEAVFAAAARGDERAVRLVARMADGLGALIGAAVLLYDPDVVVVGGGVSGAGDALMVPLRASLARHALASHVGALRLERAALGERAGVVGAGLAAWDAATGLPF